MHLRSSFRSLYVKSTVQLAKPNGYRSRSNMATGQTNCLPRHINRAEQTGQLAKTTGLPAKPSQPTGQPGHQTTSHPMVQPANQENQSASHPDLREALPIACQQLVFHVQVDVQLICFTLNELPKIHCVFVYGIRLFRAQAC